MSVNPKELIVPIGADEKRIFSSSFQNVAPAQTTLADLVDLETYQSRSANVFPTMNALRWYIRQNRERLIETGALLHIARKSWILPVRFDSLVLSLGRDQRTYIRKTEGGAA